MDGWMDIIKLILLMKKKNGGGDLFSSVWHPRKGRFSFMRKEKNKYN
jgi:hypothetical protein